MQSDIAMFSKMWEEHVEELGEIFRTSNMQD